MDALHRHRSLYKGTTPPWKETYRRVRHQMLTSQLASMSGRRELLSEFNTVLLWFCLLTFVALCRQTQKQPVEAAGEIPSDGGEPAGRRLRGLHHRPGGDGGGMDGPAVRGPETALAVGSRRHGRGRAFSFRSSSLGILSMCVSRPVSGSRCYLLLAL